MLTKSVLLALYDRYINTKRKLPKDAITQVKLYANWKATTPEKFISKIFTARKTSGIVNIEFKNGNRTRYINKFVDVDKKKETAKYAIDLFNEMFLKNNHSNGNINNVYPVEVTFTSNKELQKRAAEAAARYKRVYKPKKLNKKQKARRAELARLRRKALKEVASKQTKFYERIGNSVYDKITGKLVGHIVNYRFKRL